MTAQTIYYVAGAIIDHLSLANARAHADELVRNGIISYPVTIRARVGDGEPGDVESWYGIALSDERVVVVDREYGESYAPRIIVDTINDIFRKHGRTPIATIRDAKRCRHTLMADLFINGAHARSWESRGIREDLAFFADNDWSIRETKRTRYFHDSRYHVYLTNAAEMPDSQTLVFRYSA